jgi:exosortase J
MSAFPDSEIPLRGVRRWELSPVQFAALGTTLAVLGLSTIWPTLLTLWIIWTTDALKSIGMVVPLVSLILILRAWRALGWEAEGTWWGVLLLLISMGAAQVQRQGVLILVISPRWSTALPPPSLVLLAYGSGIVLLLGGIRLYRAALFPILLLWFANPIPHAFSLLVDLPLQHASAHIARVFASDLGYSLTPDHLRLMFTPDFGMFIAPGCNGVRGSVTMGFIALIAGYVYRFRWYANGLIVTGAILLGYLFNLARLCLLVLYYVVALHFTSLQNKAENADYLIGAALFLLATFLLFTVIHHFREARNPNWADVAGGPRRGGLHDGTTSVRYARLGVMGVIVLRGFIGLPQANAAIHEATSTVANVAAEFSQRLGNYTLARSWNETLPTGTVVYVWGQYVPAGGGTPIAIGVSPVLGWHDPLMCHFIRGEHALWQGPLTVSTADAVPVNFSSAFYNDGVTQHIEASTQCIGTSCDEFATERTHFGFVYSRLEPISLFNADPQQPTRVLLRVETVDTSLPDDVARQQLTQGLRTFLASVKLDDLTRPYSR